ncbi:MAG: hypothetical protein A2Z16_06080 [Chloroflexi bacterium RBG_16_54_18]|nr:MAG: hypothetical protein A2Z16_06080 [Chloroflexi bacterium RBG_16_54_18]
MTRADWLLLVETTIWLFIARLAVLILPFRWVMRTCGIQNHESPQTVASEKEPLVERVTWAVDALRWATPWDSNCLARSIAGKRLLKRRGLTSTLYLGVAKSDPKTLIAHSWLRCGQYFVSGAPEHEQFTVVSKFAER